VLRVEQRVAVRSQLVPDLARLVGSSRDDGDRCGGQTLRVGGRAALGRRLRLRLPHLMRDPLVLHADGVQKVDVVQEVAEARRRDQERQRVGRLVHVDGANSLLEHGDHTPILGLQTRQALRLNPKPSVPPRELRAL
jgi:hypothetical protein